MYSTNDQKPFKGAINLRELISHVHTLAVGTKLKPLYGSPVNKETQTTCRISFCVREFQLLQQMACQRNS